MWDAECAVSALRARGELWEMGPGLIGLRGDALSLLRAIESEVEIMAGAEDADEWRVPPPRRSTAPANGALLPVVCYHCYARHAGTTIPRRVAISARQTCWRNEDGRPTPLERDWSFTLREIVVLGTADATRTFLRRGRLAATRLAESLGIEMRISEADGPGLGTAPPGWEPLHPVKGAGTELLIPIARGRELAIASFNDHQRFFGEAFRIELPEGGYANTACIAFALERWLLAVLVAHGPDARAWPTVGAAAGTLDDSETEIGFMAVSGIF